MEVTMSNAINTNATSVSNDSAAKAADAAKAAAEAAKAVATANFVQSLVAELDGLSANCISWEKTSFKTANEELYALLARCLAIFESRFQNASDQERAALRKEVLARLQGKGIRVVKQSATLTMFIRLLFNSDRKRANSYAYVLTAAMTHGVRSAELAHWITQTGGIEEVKRRHLVKPETAQRQAELAQTRHRLESEIAQAHDAPLAQVALNGLEGDYVLLLARPNQDGQGARVVGVLPDASESLRKGLLQQLAKQRVAQAAELAKVAREAALLQVGGSSNDAQGRLSA
jgi:hypothetical protein